MRTALIAFAWMASLAHAAPDEAILGKGEGYPVCPPAALVELRCLVGEVSRRDEIYTSRKIAKAAIPRALQRAAEPDIRYRYQSEERGIDGYLANHRVTGLVIAKGPRSCTGRCSARAREVWRPLRLSTRANASPA